MTGALHHKRKAEKKDNQAWSRRVFPYLSREPFSAYSDHHRLRELSDRLSSIAPSAHLWQQQQQQHFTAGQDFMIILCLAR